MESPGLKVQQGAEARKLGYNALMRLRLLSLMLLPLGMLAAQGSPQADRARFETACGACHTTAMVSEFRSAPEWEETIEKMVSIGAKASQEQLDAALRFLLRTWTKVNINTAEAGDLPLVLDIPQDTAQALVRYRAEHGNFKTLDDLKKVPGLDPAKLAARQDRIVF